MRAAFVRDCYALVVAQPTADHLREYARRDWSFRASTKAIVPSPKTPDEALALSQMLWEHMRSIDPSWPDDAQRQADLEHHQRLAQIMRRLSDVPFLRLCP